MALSYDENGETIRVPREPREFAKVVWDAEDVRTLRPQMTEEEAMDFLERNEKWFRDRMIEEGWDIMRDLLREEEVEREEDVSEV